MNFRKLGLSCCVFVATLALGAVARADVDTTQAVPDVAAGWDVTPVDQLPHQPDMPDPLVGADGLRITTRAQWEKRRAEMRRIIEYYMLGTMPPPPGNVVGEDRKSKTLADGKVKYRLVKLSFGPESKLGFEIAIFTPTGAGPFPTIVNPSFFPTPGGSAPPPTFGPGPATQAAPVIPATVPGVGAATRPSTQSMRAFFARFGDPDSAAANLKPILDRGYAVVIYNYQQCGADRLDDRNTGFFPAYPGYDWGAIGAWAWGMSRVVDYLETQEFADKHELIAVGHSRLGKTTLAAGAFDDRFALVAPVGSGCAGTGAFRFNGPGRGGKQGLEDITKRFSWQFGPRLHEFTGQVDRLPFDDHWLMALVAPRALISAEGLDDGACNGMATKHDYLAAKPVFEFLGVPDRLGVNFRPGRHALTDLDWQAILDFGDKELRGMKVDRSFDQFPPDDQLH